MSTFDDILQIVAENGYLEPRFLILFKKKLGEHSTLLSWKRLNEKYNEHLKTAPDGVEMKFDKGTDLSSFTRCKKEFKLDFEDVRPLNYTYVYVAKARSYFKFYKTADVINAFYKKYYYENVKQESKEKDEKRNKRLCERRFYLEKALDSKNPYLLNVLDNHLICQSFMSNGLHKTQLKSFLKDFKNAFHSIQHTFPDMCSSDVYQKASRIHFTSLDNIIQDEHAFRKRIEIDKQLSTYEDYNFLYKSYANLFHNIDINKSPDEIMNSIRQVYNREAELEEELEKHGLILRSDSEMCRNYIYHNYPSMNEVVNIMIEMNWFFNYTEYSSIIRNMYFDSFYDYDETDHFINKYQMSLNAKKTAYRNYIRKNKGNTDDVPKYVQEKYKYLIK